MMVHMKQKAWMQYVSPRKAMRDVLFYPRNMPAYGRPRLLLLQFTYKNPSSTGSHWT
jgi:hypothetical protein